MNPKLFLNKDFIKIREEINREIKRRGTFRWWDPLVPPEVGQDRTPPLVIPREEPEQLLTDKTYVINTPSKEALEKTKNIHFDAIGDSLADGRDSSSKVTVDELRNMLVGLSKITDINMYYGRDEEPGLAFRDPNNIKEAVEKAKAAPLNVPLHESPLSPTKRDPNDGIKNEMNPAYPVMNSTVTYPMENGKYVMPSGESDGEEGIPSETNFFDDYKPFSPHISEVVDRSWRNEGRNRNETISRTEGGVSSSTYGTGPRNPSTGNPYRSRDVYGGVPNSCTAACTGTCYMTCDNACSESCTTTCWNRCGNACTNTCGNVCTGCTTLCYNTCKTKCEETAGYSCLHAGFIPGRGNPYICDGCSYTCRFYPNKSALCTDSGCVSMCINTCLYGCISSCTGGCIDNASENTSYTSGRGRGCMNNCTINCIGDCQGVCVSMCVHSCWNTCKASCHDNCTWGCETNCGTGCATTCINGCTNNCSSLSSNRPSQCGTAGCTSTCKHDCNNNCVGNGCRSMCGTEGGTSCSANCRMSCANASCAAMCENACVSQCSTCVNSCGFNCGNHCYSNCGNECATNCSNDCRQSCQLDCVGMCMFSCMNECSGCSNLCYSCVGMCIGTCSVKCEYGCSSCSNNCSWWCDGSCNRACYGSCEDRCISTCSGSCSTLVQSYTSSGLSGPRIPPTSQGYIVSNPTNRVEERESLKIIR